MKHAFLLLTLAFSMAVSAVTTVGVQDQKILLTQDDQTIILAPNGENESYYWVSLSPDGSKILYSTAHHGTCICDLQGHLLRSLGRLNAPKWMDNENVSGMQEHYAPNEHDVVDHIDYYSFNLSSMKQRALTKAEQKEFIRLENARLEAADAANMARAAARRRAMMDNPQVGLAGLKIYVNAGHGGHDPNDRSCWTIPVPETWTNPNGYWESNSNLVKALALRDLLEAAGATVIMSRVTNNSGERDIQYYSYAKGSPEYNAIMAGDDRDLSAIAEEANANDVDHFLSIHSNALNGMTNYLLLLYHGENGKPTVATSDAMAANSGAIQIQNKLTVWTASSPLLRGDITFYGDSPTDSYAGLGVLRPLTVPGFLSEGSFHDYAPETHRLCNADYCKIEAIRFFQHFHKYYNRTLPQTATISGWVKSANEKVDVLGQPKFVYVAGSDDQWLPLNGAQVILKNANGQPLDTVVTDDWYNGIFAFYDLQPGTYQVEASLNGYKTVTQTVTVAAEDIAGMKFRLKNTHMDVPDYPDPDQDAGTLPLEKYDFKTVGDVKAESGNVYSRIINKGDMIITLGSNGIIRRNWDFTAVDTIPMPAGVTISDIALTADEYLVGSAAGNGTMTLYVWDDNFRNPTVFFTETGISGKVGYTIATRGPLWKVKVFTAANNHIYSIQYDENQPTNVVAEVKSTSLAADSVRLTVTPEGDVYPDWRTVPTYFRYANQSYEVNAFQGNNASYEIELITGQGSSTVVSSIYDMDGGAAAYAMAVAYVDGYTIHVGLLAQDGAGNARFGRWESIEIPVANIYASEVSFDGQKFRFRLNENATSVFLSIEKEGEMKDGVELGALTKGLHEIANPFGTQGFDAFSVTPKARPVGRPLTISSDDPIFQFYAPRGVAIDKTPSSPFFGRIYVAEGLGGPTSPGGRVAPAYRTTVTGMYVLSADFTDITNQGASAWTGNVAWGPNKTGTGENYQFSVARPGVAPDGKVFIPSSSFSSTGVYIMDAANPAADFVPVFSGRRSEENGSIKSQGVLVTNPVMSCAVLGTGAEAVLYTMDRNTTPYTNINRYDIGQDSLPWKKAPSAIVYDDALTAHMANGNGEIAYDGHGGWFMSQYRASKMSSTQNPALIHVTNGVLDYNCSSFIPSSIQGGMAVSADGSLVAIGQERGEVGVYGVEYDADNVPTLTQKYIIKWADDWGEGNNMGIDFDAAGNLYIVSNTNERLMIYSLPKLNNSYTTRISYHQEETGVKNLREEDTTVTKVVHNGQVLILKDGHIYNALGVEMK